ncbi:hypothetical protein EPN95_03855 [Patescibacteria group bacterium]|nr:MAG: hypothetical protein EPN95_03855 [Patescibacteria group bacterium]
MVAVLLLVETVGAVASFVALSYIGHLFYLDPDNRLPRVVDFRELRDILVVAVLWWVVIAVALCFVILALACSPWTYKRPKKSMPAETIGL